ncbi:ABC transporter permease subunit [Flexivirga sp. ID2601S]|uniref:ABC transporter permease subunit n=1 Tax=Flexivirga aerilata TaxID=1656889 RepID=A0A849AFK1_9MICO|nr:ABC transporter permease subunit [Flexivirga aerilata]NNG38657.1 ABC transporter permease subunit [Flexivirga aerilata]
MILTDTWHWLVNGANWSGTDGILHRLEQHVIYTLITLVIACLIALPLGFWIAHTGRGRFLVSLANAARAVPSLGLLCILGIWASSHISGDLALTGPSIAVLVVLALPPLLAGAYAGITEVDPAARDAAKGMGMTGTQVFTKVELPNSLPLVFSGLRSASLQVIATATIAAFLGIGGLGRFLLDGQASGEYQVMIGGSVLVAALALLVDLLFAVAQRRLVSPGLTGRRVHRHTTGAGSGNLDPATIPDDKRVTA